MHEGQIVETGPTDQRLRRPAAPLHPHPGRRRAHAGQGARRRHRGRPRTAARPRGEVSSSVHTQQFPEGLPVGETWHPAPGTAEVRFPYDGSVVAHGAGRGRRRWRRRAVEEALAVRDRVGRLPSHVRRQALLATHEAVASRRTDFERAARPRDRQAAGRLPGRGRPHPADAADGGRGGGPAARRDGAAGPAAERRRAARLLGPQADRRGGRHRGLQLPAAAGHPQDRAGPRRRLPDHRQARAADAAGHALAGPPGARGARRGRRPARRGAAGDRGPEVGVALTTDPRLGAVSFTGSAAVGHQIARDAAPTKVLLELGSNAALVVAADADLDAAADAVVRGGYYASGQACISVQRVVVVETVRDAFLERLDRADGRRRRRRPPRRGDPGLGAHRRALDRAGARLGRRGGRRRRRASWSAARSPTRWSRPTVLRRRARRAAGLGRGGLRPGGRGALRARPGHGVRRRQRLALRPARQRVHRLARHRVRRRSTGSRSGEWWSTRCPASAPT